MKKVLFILLLAVSGAAQAANYYFSSVSGNDTRTVQQARSSSTPWQSINKLNAIMAQLQPGDSILFKRGDTFYGAINVTISGTRFSPIVFSAYGNGAKPKITGFTTISSWSPVGNGVFEAACTSCNTSLNMVTIGDTLQPIGRFPKLSDGNGGYWTISGHSGNTVQSADLAGKPNFTGGEIVMRKYQWIMDRATINSQAGTSITYTPLLSPRHPNFNYEPFDGHGFFIQNHPSTFTRPGDWSYDKNSQKIKMYQPGSSTVKATTIESLVNAEHKEYLTFYNLAFRGSNLKTFNLVSCNNVSISYCDMDFAGTDAINFDTDSLFRNIVPDSSLRLPNDDPSYEDEYRDPYAPPRYVNTDTSYAMTVEFCTINNTNNNAFYASNTYKSVVQNNIITNTALNRGMGLSGDQQYFAILYVGSKSIIRNNIIRRSGYIGIHFEGDSTIVRNNVVDSFCMVKSDGGGIYTQGELKKRGRKITSNIVLNGIGDRFGLTTEIKNNAFAGNVHGIYIDNNAQYVEIDSNTVARVEGNAFELNGANFITARNNTFYDGTRAQVDYQQLKRGFAGLNIKQNIFFAKKADQLIGLYHGNFNNQVNTWGTIDSNYYCRPVLEPQGIDTGGYSKAPFLIDYPDGGIIEGTNGRFYSLDKWQALSGQDAHTVKSPAGIDPAGTRFEYNATNQPRMVALSGQYIDVKNQWYQGNITLPPFSSLILLKKVSPVNGQTINFSPLANRTFGDGNFTVNASASSGLPVSFTIISGPATISGNTITLTGTGTVLVEATQAGNSAYSAAVPVRQSFDVAPAGGSNTTTACSATGSITREQWTNIFGTAVTDIPLNTTPQSSAPIYKLETETTGDWMGARIRGYICPPLTGNYTFTMAGDDGVELWLSTSNDPAAKVKIAGYIGWTGFHEFDKYPGQVSAPIYLQAGQPYYIEVLHKNGAGGDHVSVKWTMPNGVSETPIPGSRLSPFTGVVNKQSQTISFGPLANKTAGDPNFNLNATASSGLAVSFRIASGPATIAGNTVTISGSGTVVVEASQAGNATYFAAPPVSQSFTVMPVAGSNPTSCSATGSITREQWTNIFGTAVTDIPLNTTPQSSAPIYKLETETTGDWMGARIRGYICPPLTGNYTFTMAGDDGVELWLSTSNDPAAKVKIAGYIGWTGFHEFDKYPGQVSAPIYLQAGQPYYIEVLHKNGAGGDHVSVKWTMPNGVSETPIPGSRLSPFTGVVNKQSQTISFGPLANKTAGDPNFNLNATASSGLAVSFRIASGPATIAGNTVTISGSGTVVVEASQAGNATYFAAPPVSQSFTVMPVAGSNPTSCSATGSITREQWTNIFGTAVTDIPLNTTPQSSAPIYKLETETTGDWMGARIRGYICPPLTGNYTFTMAGDDGVELWLSTSNDPAAKVKIAGYIGWTGFHEFDKYPGQVSAPIYLQAGQPYYIEVLHKNGAGGDHVSVKWTMPNGVSETPIPGSRLSPYTTVVVNKNSLMAGAISNVVALQEGSLALQVWPNPVRNTATVQVSGNKTEKVQLIITDVQGRPVQQIFKGLQVAGTRQNMLLKTDNLPAGVYMIRLLSPTQVITKKITVVR